MMRIFHSWFIVLIVHKIVFAMELKVKQLYRKLSATHIVSTYSSAINLKCLTFPLRPSWVLCCASYARMEFYSQLYPHILTLAWHSIYTRGVGMDVCYSPVASFHCGSVMYIYSYRVRLLFLAQCRALTPTCNHIVYHWKRFQRPATKLKWV